MTQEELSELLEKKDFKSIRASLEEMNPVDIASLLEDLPDNELAVTFRLIEKSVAAETFSYMDADQQQLLLTIFTNKEIKEVLDDMFTDDTVDLLEDMPANVVSRILANLDKDDRKAVNEILRYPEDSAGSIMTTEFVDLRRKMTVKEAFAKSVRRAWTRRLSIPATLFRTTENSRALSPFLKCLWRTAIPISRT